MAPRPVFVSPYDAVVIVSALKSHLIEVEADLALLEKTRARDLDPGERALLPTGLQALPRAELRDRIDPWYSDKYQLEDLIDRFTHLDV